MATAAAIQAWAYWPGLMTWDAVRQYGQAIDGDFDDWHPPAMEWLWRQLLPLHSGPQPMLLLQLALYWGGFALLAGWALRARRPGLAVALAAMCDPADPVRADGRGAQGLSDGRRAAHRGRSARLEPRARGLGAARSGAAPAAVRRDAAVQCACSPGCRCSSHCCRATGAARRCALRDLRGVRRHCSPSALPLANRAIGAERSGVELSLVMFDLGGHQRAQRRQCLPAARRRQSGCGQSCAAIRRSNGIRTAGGSTEPCPIQFYAHARLAARSSIERYRHCGSGRCCAIRWPMPSIG